MKVTKEKKRVKIRWKITTASFALRNFTSSLPAMTIMKENDRKNDMNEKRKTNDSLSFHENKQQKQSFEKEES